MYMTQYADTLGAEVTKHSQTLEIMDTTLDLLENSDSGVDDVSRWADLFIIFVRNEPFFFML